MGEGNRIAPDQISRMSKDFCRPDWHYSVLVLADIIAYNSNIGSRGIPVSNRNCNSLLIYDLHGPRNIEVEYPNVEGIALTSSNAVHLCRAQLHRLSSKSHWGQHRRSNERSH